ncbi:MAG: ACT domain-containing protein [Phycisphaerae bacterium]|nr:ACT domain-containing protein [Phycisphaerae bacterium]
MHVDTQFSIFLVNKPGVMDAVTRALAEASVNLFALSLSDSGEHGVLRVVCDNVEKAREVLRETHDRWTETDILVVPIGNTPGAFEAVTRKLAAAGININYAFCTAAEDGGGTSTAIFKVADVEKAIQALQA